MNDLTLAFSERISALVDGRFQGEEAVQVMVELVSNPQSMETWHTYHVVGDVLRSAELAPSSCGLEFLAKLERKLVRESPHLGAVSRDSTDLVPIELQSAALERTKPAANAPVFRWVAMAGIACSALVAVVGTALWSQMNPRSGGQMSSVEPQTVAVGSNKELMIRDPRLDELMAAHRQLGGHSAFQVPAGFLRNATFEGPSR